VPRIFEISASPEKSVRLNTNGTGEVTFTVTNVTDTPARGRAVLGPEESPVLKWLELTGDKERMIQPKMSDPFVVKVKIPPGTNPGDYKFRLDAVSVARPDEDSTEGPTVGIPVTLTPPPPKKFPWWIPVAALVIIGAGIVVAFMVMGGDVEVPNLSQKSVSDGEALLTANKLKLGKVENVVGDASQVDRIVKQTPEPKAKVKSGSSVDIQVGVPNEVTVPDLTGKNLADGEAFLRASHLQLGKTDYLIRDTSQIDLIQNQTPKAPGKLPPDSKVDVQVGAAIVVVPPLTGTLEDAVKALTAAHLDQGDITTVTQPGILKPGQVLASKPKSGEQAQSHTRVALTVQAGTVNVPDLKSQNIGTVANFLASNNLTLGTVTGQTFQLIPIAGGRGGFTSQPNFVTTWSPQGTVPVGTAINIGFPGGFRVLPRNAVNSLFSSEILKNSTK
jgi:beta-lactam-binding protein with PASTA domain